MRIFRVQRNDPLLWQKSYTDTEVTKILERRDRAIVHDMNRFNVYRQGGIRQAAKAALKEEAKRTKDAIDHGDKQVPKMELEEGEQCCICFEEMYSD